MSRARAATPASRACRRAEPDGYTLVIGHWGSHVVNGATYTLTYDLLKDFEPIAWIANTPQWIITRKTMPANNLQELVAWVKANNATAGTIGAAGPGVVAGAYFKKLTGASFTYVPYRGGGPAIQDLVAGQIDLLFDQAANSLAQFRSGNVKVYAVMAPTRWAAAPDVPTVDEAGVPNLYATYWHGMWAPKGTPKEIIAKLNAAIVAALADPGVREKLANLGQEIPAARPADTGGARRPAQGRNRKMVADHQGGEYQGGMTNPPARDTDKCRAVVSMGLAMNSTNTPPPIWDFVLGYYRQQGVSEAAIALQDSAGIDVNMILFLMWLSGQRKTLAEADMRKLGETSHGWQHSVVVPIRNMRRLLKENAPLVEQETALAYRKKVQALEIEGEQLAAQCDGGGLARRLRSSAAASAEQAARDNLAAFAKRDRQAIPGSRGRDVRARADGSRSHGQVPKEPRRLIVGISGASGVIYGVRLLEMLRDKDIETHLVMSKSAEMTLAYETDLKPKDVKALASVTHPIADIGASISSGSFRTMGMVIVPCSIRTMSEIATGVTTYAAVARCRCRVEGKAPAGAGVARNAAAWRPSAHHGDAVGYRRRGRADRAGALHQAEDGRRHRQSYGRPPARFFRHRNVDQALAGRPRE